MRILFDQNVPSTLRNLLPGHDVRTAAEMGWSTLVNGILVDAAEAGRFRGDDNCGQEFSVSGQYQRAEPHGDYSFDQSLANTSAWRSGYSARVATRAARIVSPGVCGPISSAPIRSSAKPIAWRICIRLQTRLFSKERPGPVAAAVAFDQAVIAQDGDS